MINYKQILEAVNRGIKFALDDFEDQEEVQGQSSSKVKHQDGTKEWLDLMNEVVDLGLPSGTLWCKYNLGVNPHLLSKAEDWYGGYYAWGEITNKNFYKQDNYKFGYAGDNLSKYNKNDNLPELLSEDDAAYQTKKLHNFKFRIPTKEDFKELIAGTTNSWVTNYNGISGLNGRVFTSSNGNTLFIPAAGFHESSSKVYYVGSDCYLWSSSINLEYPYGAYYLHIYSDNIVIDRGYRYYGLAIHPVIKL